MLVEGGSFLVKMFTLFEHSSICLVYILKCLFECVVINKPIMSTPGNSETYIICKGFLKSKFNDETRDKLLAHCGTQWPRDRYVSVST